MVEAITLAGGQRAPGARVMVDYRAMRVSTSAGQPVDLSVTGPTTAAVRLDVSSGASSEAAPQDTPMSRSIHPQLQAPVSKALASIGANIQQARKSGFRMSRQRFADVLGCTAVTLDRIERGDPGVATVYYFAALEVTRCLSRVVESTDPDALVMSMAPISWPEDAGSDFPDFPSSQVDLPGSGEPAQAPSPAPRPAAAAAVAKPSPAPAPAPVAKPSVEKQASTGYGPVITPPWERK